MSKENGGLLAIKSVNPLEGFTLTTDEDSPAQFVDIKIFDDSGKIVIAEGIIDLGRCELDQEVLLVKLDNGNFKRNSAYIFRFGTYNVVAKALVNGEPCEEVRLKWVLNKEQALQINKTIPNGSGTSETSTRVAPTTTAILQTTTAPTVRTADDWKRLFENCQSRLDLAERAITASTELSESLRQVEKQRNSLELELHEARAQNGKEAEKINALTASNAALTTDIEQLKEQVATLETTNQRLAAQNATDTAAYEEFRVLLKEEIDRDTSK